MRVIFSQLPNRLPQIASSGCLIFILEVLRVKDGSTLQKAAQNCLSSLFESAVRDVSILFANRQLIMIKFFLRSAKDGKININKKLLIIPTRHINVLRGDNE